MTGGLAGRAIDRLACRRRRQLEAVWRDPAGAQERALQRLVAAARDTEFGLEHRFRSVTGVADYQERVPVRDYLQHRGWLERAGSGSGR
jgi:GH3 auxin-responsive promoter